MEGGMEICDDVRLDETRSTINSLAPTVDQPTDASSNDGEERSDSTAAVVPPAFKLAVEAATNTTTTTTATDNGDENRGCSLL